jgi:hypothetical protein
MKSNMENVTDNWRYGREQKVKITTGSVKFIDQSSEWTCKPNCQNDTKKVSVDSKIWEKKFAVLKQDGCKNLMFWE